jgi:CBS domain-containing protein
MRKKRRLAMATKVRDAMTPGVQSVPPTESLPTAATMMRENDVGSIPVVDGNQLVGIVTDRDIVARAVAENADLRTTTVGDVASRDVVTVGPDDDLDEARRLMAEQQVRRLPVVDRGRIVGMLAQADVAMMAKEKDSGEMLEEISQPTSTPRS